MKKTLTFLAIVIITLPSCTKKYCWKCNIVNVISGTEDNHSTVVATNVCDMSKKEIQQYEQSMTTTARSGTATVRQTASCQLK